jgi:sulfur carrier protein ThiS
MKIEINLYATLARYLPDEVKQDGGVLDVGAGAKVSDVLKRLKIPEDQVKLVFVDGTHADGDSALKEGSRLGVFPPVGGG